MGDLERDLDLDFDLDRDLAADFDLERLLADEEEVEEASSSLVGVAFTGFSVTLSGRLLTASEIAASAPLTLTGVGRRGSGDGVGEGISSGLLQGGHLRKVLRYLMQDFQGDRGSIYWYFSI